MMELVHTDETKSVYKLTPNTPPVGEQKTKEEKVKALKKLQAGEIALSDFKQQMGAGPAALYVNVIHSGVPLANSETDVIL